MRIRNRGCVFWFGNGVLGFCVAVVWVRASQHNKVYWGSCKREVNPLLISHVSLLSVHLFDGGTDVLLPY